MRKFLQVLVVGLLLLGLSSMAGAAEWKRVELTEGVPMSLELPTAGLIEEKNHGNFGDFAYGFFYPESDLMIFVTQVQLDQEMRKEYPGDFPFDRVKDEELKDLAKEIGISEEFKGVKIGYLPKGQKVIFNDFVGKYGSGQEMNLFGKGYYLSMIVSKKGGLTLKEQEMVKQIFDSLQNH